MNTINCSCTNGCQSCNQFNPCAVKCGCCCGRFGDYAYIYNTTAQTAAAGDTITFSSNGPLSGTITHTTGTDSIAIGNTGVYLVKYYVDSTQDGEVSVYRNSEPVTGSTRAVEGTGNGEFLLAAQVGDVLTLVNTGDAEAQLEDGGAAPEAVVNAAVTIIRVF